jgi:hypothetical protein
MFMDTKRSFSRSRLIDEDEKLKLDLQKMKVSDVYPHTQFSALLFH